MAQEEELQLPITMAEATVKVDNRRVLESIQKMLLYKKPKPQSTAQPCTIFKVRERIRKVDAAAYDPQIISIGPFHREKNPALLHMELLKPQYLDDLINRHPSNKLHKFIEAVSIPAFLENVNKCYSEQVVFPDNGQAFVEMMVLDGCFIIEFLVKSFFADDMSELASDNHSRSVVENDLLLLENQIPFSVIQSLFESCVIPGITDTSPPIKLHELAVCCISRDIVENPPPIPEVIHHLLHLRHSSLKPPPPPPENTLEEAFPRTCRLVPQWLYRKFMRIVSHSFFFVLSLLLNCGWPDLDETAHGGMPQRAPRMTKCATELDEAGIEFKNKRDANCFLDVTFVDGTMEIPMLSIQGMTISQFRNLIAFEQCCPMFGNYFTSYVALIDNLIDNAKDVAILKSKGVLESKLSSDEDVAVFFNSLNNGSSLNYDKHYLVGLFSGLKNYCAIASHGWRAKLVHDYFGNPWSTISLVAAGFLLLLTVLQSIVAILAYVRPPKSPS